MGVEDSEYQDWVEWLTAKVARYGNLPPEMIDLDTPLADYGIDSESGLELCADLEREKGVAVETTIIWDYGTVDAIATHLAAQRSSQ
ncbi:MAG: acyl carrier protein [Mycolicibacterium sp.]|uniref:acyl carrier protein n=1 Tax=Mycolicibacterium sp. TaxID=2320850 RepID=UPI003D15146F